MNTHQMKLAKSPFEKIANGQKNIESRLFDEKRKLINVGDKIEFVQSDNAEEKVVTRVKALYRYETFEKLFFDFPAAYFGGETKEDLLQEIHQFYSLDEEKEFGVVGIKIEKE